MAQEEEIRFKEYRERFATENSCRAELFRLRFSEEFVCPKCGGREFYHIKGETPISAVVVAIRLPSPPKRLCIAPVCP